MEERGIGSPYGILVASRKDVDATFARFKARVVSGTDLQSVPAKPPGLPSWGLSYVLAPVGSRLTIATRLEAGRAKSEWLPLTASSSTGANQSGWL